MLRISSRARCDDEAFEYALFMRLKHFAATFFVGMLLPISSSHRCRKSGCRFAEQGKRFLVSSKFFQFSSLYKLAAQYSGGTI